MQITLTLEEELRYLLEEELRYLNKYNKTSIVISTTAKHDLQFKVLPRRILGDLSMSCFMINNKEKLIDTLSFFDKKVDYIFIDIEQKQKINLYKIARETIKNSILVTVKPNDSTLESCDILIRNNFKDDLIDKNIVVIGTGNLASKIALRLSERQANVYIKGRTKTKENLIINGLNSFLPKFAPSIKAFEQLEKTKRADVIISFLSSLFVEEEILYSYIDKETFIIDGGINNFSSNFIEKMLSNNVEITRLDTRIALPYQLLSTHNFTQTFFNEIYGRGKIQDIPVVAGGYIGSKGTVIVDNIKNPIQVIGVADGYGGVKSDEQLTETDRKYIREIRKAISINN